jgi:hypothetical protein
VADEVSKIASLSPKLESKEMTPVYSTQEHDQTLKQD